MRQCLFAWLFTMRPQTADLIETKFATEVCTVRESILGTVQRGYLKWQEREEKKLVLGCPQVCRCETPGEQVQRPGGGRVSKCALGYPQVCNRSVPK
jgi:hypothetical protein